MKEKINRPIKLTIGIPTFNGWDYLEQSLSIIIEQISRIDGVEILICDNASIDETGVGVNKLLHTHPEKIRYIRHAKNIGMDANFWSVINNAAGEYVHFLGDDDYYLDGGVARLMERLNDSTVDYCILSNRYLNTINGRFIETSDSLGIGLYIKNSGKEFLLAEGLKSLALSNVVIKRSICLEVDSIEDYIGCQWLHLFLIVETLRPDSSAYIFGSKNPIVCVRIGNQRWLENDGAISYYCSALKILNRPNKKFGRQCTREISRQFIPLLSNGAGIKFKSTLKNIRCLLHIGRYLYSYPGDYFVICMRVLLKRRRPFFSGWENYGSNDD